MAAQEYDFAGLHEDALDTIYALLSSCSLRAAAATNSAWCRALRRSPQHVRRRASWPHEWTLAGAGALIQHKDGAVCAGDGTWEGGVALASTLKLSRAHASGFRLVIEVAAPGDLLMGITRYQPEVDGIVGAGDGVEELSLLDMRYHYIMGRRIDANGDARLDGGDAGRAAPRSIFYGGRSRRCCFATPTLQYSGPSIDMGHDGSSPGKLAKLKHVGDWVEFSLSAGRLCATDHTGHSFLWGTQVGEGELWVPTMAWTGSRASVRLAPPELPASSDE